MTPKIVQVAVPRYTVGREPDFVRVGSQVDRALEANFPDGKYVLRAIGLEDHPGLTLDELVDVVRTSGTDKYDPRIKGVSHDEFSGYDYDIQAGPIEIRRSRLVVSPEARYRTVFGEIAWHFYRDAALDRGHAVRIDLLMLYDPHQVKRAHKFHAKARGVRKGLNRWLYKFQDQRDKQHALLGLVKVLR